GDRWRQNIRKFGLYWRLLASYGDHVALTSPGDLWRPQERRQAPYGDQHAEQSVVWRFRSKTPPKFP
ncbi:hypothetical protein A2U01_0074091, partial [Trifolium medium]|nr:hypothetical protein [Trifolium medium]